MSVDQASQLIDSAARLSDMADKVAGFAISSNLLLTFACLKDIAKWVQNHSKAFLVGICVGGILYIGAVWYLYSQEDHLRALGLDGLAPAYLTVAHVTWLLAFSRSVGIFAATVISILAVLGTRHGPRGT